MHSVGAPRSNQGEPTAAYGGVPAQLAYDRKKLGVLAIFWPIQTILYAVTAPPYVPLNSMDRQPSHSLFPFL